MNGCFLFAEQIKAMIAVPLESLGKNEHKYVGYESIIIVILQWRTINDNDMISYSLTTMMYFLTKKWYGFPAYTVNLFIKAY